jgi:hypothetical protein
VCLGCDHADDGHGQLLLQLRERRRGRRVTGGEDQLHALPLQPAGDLPREAADLGQWAWPIGKSRTVSEVDDVFVRHRHQALVEDGQAAHARVEDPHRPGIHRAIVGCANMRLAALAVTLVGVLLSAALAGARPTESPGVTSGEIVLGGTAPLTGPESAYSVVAQGANAYFQYVNDHGGVFGRKVRYVYRDDAYEVAKTFTATKELVEQDHSFAIFNTVGTEHALAIRSYLNGLGIPEVFVGSGASLLVRDAKKYPWTLGYLPSFVAEGKVYGRYLARTRPAARIAVLYEASDFGRDLISGLSRPGCAARAISSQSRRTPSPTMI